MKDMMDLANSVALLAAAKHDVFLPSWPAITVHLLTLLAAAGWVALHFLRPARPGAARWAMLPLRLAVGYAAVSLLLQSLLRHLVLATNWDLWPLSLGGAACVELIVSFYRLERSTVSRRMGYLLMGLRLALLVLVLIMIAQPVRSVDLTRKLQRFVAVLVDNSASMHIPETQLKPSEKVRLAEMLGVEKRPYHLERSAQALRQTRAELSAKHDHLVALAQSKGDVFANQLADYSSGLLKALQAADKVARDQAEAVDKTIKGKLRLDKDAKLLADLYDIRSKFQVQVQQRLADAVKILQQGDRKALVREYEALKTAIAQAATVMGDLEERLSQASVSLDKIFLDSLPPERQAKIASVADKTRHMLARDVLLAPMETAKGETKLSLMDQVQAEYEVKVYTFASAAAEVNLDEWRKAAPPRASASSQPATAPASVPATGPASPTVADRAMAAVADLPAELQETNLAAALQQVIADMKGKDLAGVILLSDGRQNAGDRVDILARDLGIQNAPVCPIVFGSELPPRDVAIVALEAPETVYAQDKVYVKADIKLDGLAGETVKVVLYDGKRQVGQTTVEVPQVDRFRKQVQLADEPKEAGLHAYRMEVEGVAGEVFAANNEYPFTVSVSNDQTRLLLVDGRSRWEFRYLKNLFDMRDRSVRLQYVLLEPDRIAGQPPRAEVHASAARPPDQTEATSLPRELAEWLKFDVIILGDVNPAHLSADHVEALRKFVYDRAGALIVVAGPSYMPRAYAGTKLEEMLPASLPPPAELASAAAEGGFRFALTAEGRENVIMRQEVDPKENLRVWESVPDIHWRHPIKEARPAASVLAYALPPVPPDPVRRALAQETSGQDALSPDGAAPDRSELADQLRQYQRERALVLFHNVGMGKVMMMTTDHTWRMRYQVGDTYHHRFWGQVLRWANANKLPSGTDLVKIGTDRSRYSPRSKVIVRAKIVQPDFTPVRTDEVRVNVFAEKDNTLKMWRKLDFVEDSPGVYSGELSDLPSGSYRVELDAPAAKPLLARDNVEKVGTAFSIDPAAPTEQIELAADRGLLGRLATLSGGKVVDPPQAASVLDVLGTNRKVEREHREYVIWNSWPLLVLLVAIAATEWILRKKVGLA